MRREPLITVATITAAVTAVLGLLVASGVDVSDDLQKAILGVVAVAAPLVVGFLARPKVTPVASVTEAVDASSRDGFEA